MNNAPLEICWKKSGLGRATVCFHRRPSLNRTQVHIKEIVKEKKKPSKRGIALYFTEPLCNILHILLYNGLAYNNTLVS